MSRRWRIIKPEVLPEGSSGLRDTHVLCDNGLGERCFVDRRDAWDDAEVPRDIRLYYERQILAAEVAGNKLLRLMESKVRWYAEKARYNYDVCDIRMADCLEKLADEMTEMAGWEGPPATLSEYLAQGSDRA